MDIYNAIEDLIAHNKFDLVFKKMLGEPHIDAKGHMNIVQLQARYNEYREERIRGLKENKAELNEIRTSLLEINEKYFSSRKSFPDEKQVQLRKSSKVTKYIYPTLIGLLAILNIYQSQTKHQIQVELTELRSSLSLDNKILSPSIKIDSFITIWNKTVMIEADSYHNGVKLQFKGIQSLESESLSIDSSTMTIKAYEGDVFHLQRGKNTNDMWGVNVVGKTNKQVHLEIYPLRS